MNRISIFLRSLLVVMVGVSCGPRWAPEPRSSPVQPASGPVFLRGVVARDSPTIVFFGKLAPREQMPARLITTFHGGDGALLQTVPLVPVQGTSSGLVYAAPRAPLKGADLQNVLEAVEARVGRGQRAQRIDLGKPVGTISAFSVDQESVYSGYPGCPDCLEDYLCRCLGELEGVTLTQAVAECPVLDESATSECEPVRW